MTRVLVIVDMQRDFIDPSGALAVPGAMDALDGIIALMTKENYALVVATQDWHPLGHCSFEENGGDFPRHCVKGTEGAQLIDIVDTIADIIIRKGTTPDREQFSGFTPELLDILEGFEQQYTDNLMVDVVGVATDYCVLATASEILSCGFKVRIPTDCVAGIELDASQHALAELERLGADIV